MLSTPLVAFVGIALELSTHFVIDVAKGRITAAYPIFADTKQKPHWQLYGLDQLLQHLVVVLLASLPAWLNLPL